MALQDLSLESAAYAIAGVVLAVFAGWLLYLSPRQRATRALSLLLLGMAAAWMQGLLWAFLGAEARVAWRALEAVAVTIIGVSTIYFLSVYPRARGWLGRSAWGGWAAVGAGASLSALFLAWPDLYTRYAVVDGEAVFLDNGPLVLLMNAWTVTAVVMLFFFARDLTRTSPGPVRRALLLVLAGFLTSMLAWTGSLLANDVSGRLSGTAIDGSFSRVGYAIEEASFFAGLAAAAIVIAHGWRSDVASVRREANALALLIGVVLTAVAVAAFAFPPPEAEHWISPSQSILDAAAGMGIAVFAGYALLKHRLFDIDVKLRWTISRGTVAVVFVAIFFVASQMAQNFLEDSMGWALGGVIAGGMLFAIAPIQRMAERVATAAVPAAAQAPHERRVDLYKLALALALSDRVITRDEERHLAKLAEELGVSHTEALAAREEMERDLGVAA